MQPDFDCLIIGGGLVGASLACALGGLPLRVGLIEAVPIQADSQPSYDDRGLVIAPASQRILEALGIWSGLHNEATPIHRIHVSDRGHFGFTRLDAQDMGVAALGHVVVARQIGHALLGRIDTLDNVDLVCPARVIGVKPDLHSVAVRLLQDDREISFTARLVVVADGGASSVRRLLNVAASEHDYRQSAVVANVTPETSHNHTAFERFTTNGPLALLPLTGHRCVAVWATETNDAERLMNLDESDFLEELGARFGFRLGRFLKLGRRRSYPLKLVLASQQVGPRFAIIGNAAHTIHPNAAQGLNLGLRDAAALAETLIHGLRAHRDIGSEDLLKTYAEQRVDDHKAIVRLSDGLARLFYNDFTPLVVARNIAMLGLDLVPPLKRGLVRRAMGLAGRQPSLVRGLTP